MKRVALKAMLLTTASTTGVSMAAEQGPLKLAVEQFVELPSDARQPEGITVNPKTGDIIIGTYDARMPESKRTNQLLRYSNDGKLVARRSFGATPLTGLAFFDGNIYVLNFGASKLQRIAATFDASTPIEDIAVFHPLTPPAPTARRIDNPDGSHDQITFGSSGFPGINGMVFDRSGNLYVSDSFQGAVYRIDKATKCAPCKVDVISRDPLLGTTAPLPFGVNGLALSKDERTLYLTNAGDGRLLRMNLPGGKVEIVAESLPGADGLLFHEGLLWVAANQADVIFGLDESGRIQARAGEFVGVDDGAPVGLLFPASTAVQGEWMVVTNLALSITPMRGDEWEEQVTRWTLSRFRLPARHDQ